jgi:hypothetical protein
MMANAVSVGSQLRAGVKHETGMVAPALSGTIEGAKNSIAAINTVLTTLRVFIGRPQSLIGK